VGHQRWHHFIFTITLVKHFNTSFTVHSEMNAEYAGINTVILSQICCCRTAISPEILVKKCPSVVEKLHYVQWDISEAPGKR